MVPQKVQLLVEEDIIQVSCGGTHSVALTKDGRMFSVELCGHATLAASHFIFSSGLVKANVIEFMTLSGVLTTRKVSVSSHLNNIDAGGDFCIELMCQLARIQEYGGEIVQACSLAYRFYTFGERERGG